MNLRGYRGSSKYEHGRDQEDGIAASCHGYLAERHSIRCCPFPEGKGRAARLTPGITSCRCLRLPLQALFQFQHAVPDVPLFAEVRRCRVRMVR